MLREKELKLLEDLKNDNARKTEEIQQLRNNQLIGQASGEETATITDGALAFANILEETEIEVAWEKRKAYIVKLPQGLSKQKVRQGYNKFNIKKWAENNLEVNNGSNLSINDTDISWTTTTTDSFTKTFVSSDNSANKEQVVEKFGLEVTGNESKTICWENPNKIECRALVSFLDENYNFISLLELGVSTEEKIIKNFTIPENSKYLTYRFGAIRADINVIYRKIMILDGAYTAETLPKYEEYGTSPSIDFPSEITNFSVNPNNLYNPENNTSGWLDESGAIHPSISSQVTDFIEIDENKFYLVEFNNNSLSATTNRIYNIYNASKNVLKSFKYNPTKDTKISIPRIKDAKYLRATFDIKMTDIVIEEEKILISINKNILPIAYDKGQHIDSVTGIDIDFIEKNKIKLNGTTTSNLNLNIINGNMFRWKKGKTYCLQLKIIEGSYSGQALYLHTGFKNDYKDVYNNLQADISNNFKNTINIDEDGYSKKCLVYAKAGIVFNNLVIEVQLEENTIATDIVIPESEEHSLRIGNLELNGINNIKDSFIVELKDENMSDKKIKKLYLKKKYDKELFKNLVWQYETQTQRVYSTTLKNIIKRTSNNNQIGNITSNICNRTSTNDLMTSNKNYLISVSNLGYVSVLNKKFNSLRDYIDYFNENNNYFIYELNEPELIELTDDYPELVKDVEYLINNFKTFKEVTHVEVDNGYIDLEYVKSTGLALKNIQQQIDNIQAVMLEGGTGNA